MNVARHAIPITSLRVLCASVVNPLFFPLSRLCAFARAGFLLSASLILATAAHAADEPFTDVAAEAGLDFVHFNGMTGQFYLIENMGSGAALFDYDNDGDLDIYVVQSDVMEPGKQRSETIIPPKPGPPVTDHLYRNDTVVNADGTRSIRFTDVTATSGIQGSHYGMGVATGDYDNDGWVDLYVLAYGANTLWHNNGDGTFSDATAKAGVGESRISVSGAFLDYDRDGLLDLYVGNYVDFSPANNRKCFAPSGERDYCNPEFYNPETDRLFRNKGDGTFEDVSDKSGIASEAGNTLGIVAADFNGDRWVDLYVASDGLPNQMWINQKNGSFVNEALLSGTAVNMEGAAEASMGVDAADFDGDGDEDLFMTHFLGETNTLYVNDGTGWFEDQSVGTGLGAPSIAYTSWGTAWFDYDNDGWLDLLVANGGINIIQVLARAGDPYPLHQPNQLFRNQGGGQFREVTAEAGAVFKLSEVTRGAAFGDIDNDGDTDVLLTNNAGPLRLLRNNLGTKSHWLGLRVLDKSGRDALGARVAFDLGNGKQFWRRARNEGSYAVANDPRILLGLGEATEVKTVRVYWPTGRVEEWSQLKANQYTMLKEGGGKEVKP